MPSCSRIASIVSAKRETARDLPLQEQPDHLALIVRLHLLAGNDDEVALAGVVGGLEGAAEDVVVGDGDRAEALRLGVVDELRRVDAAVVRPRGVHVQVGDDPRTVFERLPCPFAGCGGGCRPTRRSAPARAATAANVCSSDSARALAPSRSRSASSSARRAVAAAASSGCRSTPRGRTIAQPAAAASRVTLRRPSTPGTKIAAVFRIAARLAPSRSVRMCTRPARSRGIAGRPISERVRSRTTSQPGQLAQHADDAAGHDPLVRTQLDDDRLVLPSRREQRRVDARGEDAVVAGEPLLRRRANVVRQGDQRVEAREQLLALRARRRVAEAILGREGGDGERVRVAQREVGERRQPGIEAVDDVVAPLGEGLAQVRLHADGHAELRPARHGHRRPERDHLGRLAVLQRPPPGEQVGGPGRGRQHRHGMADGPEGRGHPGHMVVHVVRLRPRERRHQADAHRPRA